MAHIKTKNRFQKVTGMWKIKTEDYEILFLITAFLNSYRNLKIHAHLAIKGYNLNKDLFYSLFKMLKLNFFICIF